VIVLGKNARVILRPAQRCAYTIYMKRILLCIAIEVMILCAPIATYAQAPDLGSAGCFALYTVTGAVSNTGISAFKGDIGTNAGAITGFDNVNGKVYNNDPTTVQSGIDLLAAYDVLNAATPTAAHIPVLGNGETLYPGVYYIAAAGSAAADLYLDGGEDTAALFIFQIGGAFSVGAGSIVHLTNGATANNVFWKVEGAISMAASTEMKGTLIANNGAIGLGAGGLIDGRMLSTTGAISVYGVQSSTAGLCSKLSGSLPVELISFTAACMGERVKLQWSTASEINNDHFTIECSANANHWEDIATVNGAGNSNSAKTYSYIDRSQRVNGTQRYYRLKQTDMDDRYSYSPLVSIGNCANAIISAMQIYPNPSDGRFAVRIYGETEEIPSIDIYDAVGKRVTGCLGYQSRFDLSAMTAGMYFVQLHMLSGTVTQKVSVER
jgi:hypothetical protein